MGEVLAERAGENQVRAGELNSQEVRRASVEMIENGGLHGSLGITRFRTV